jgi:uncharacterized membrane protein YhiD involved in acid resistance
MDELLKQMSVTSLEGASSFTYGEFTLSLLLSIVLGTVIALVYRRTHTGVSYASSFAVTMILMSMTVSFIMLIIGSNLARAFSLVGALSIIRYRNAVRESRDTAFIFLAMAAGMACGVRLYMQASIFTGIASALLLLLNRIDFASVGREERLVRVAYEQGKWTPDAIEKTLRKLSAGRCSLLSSELAGRDQVLVYTVDTNRSKTPGKLLEQLSKQIDGAQVKILTGFESFNI